MPASPNPKLDSLLDHARNVNRALIPAEPGWSVVRGIYLGDCIPVLAWSIVGGVVHPVTIYGKESHPATLCHGDIVYRPDGRRESWADYERRADTVSRSSSKPRKGNAD